MFDWHDLWKSDEGTVTVDWVVLTAAVMVLGIVTAIPSFSGIKSATNVLAQQIAAGLSGED